MSASIRMTDAQPRQVAMQWLSYRGVSRFRLSFGYATRMRVCLVALQWASGVGYAVD